MYDEKAMVCLLGLLKNATGYLVVDVVLEDSLKAFHQSI